MYFYFWAMFWEAIFSLLFPSVLFTYYLRCVFGPKYRKNGQFQNGFMRDNNCNRNCLVITQHYESPYSFNAHLFLKMSDISKLKVI